MVPGYKEQKNGPEDSRLILQISIKRSLPIQLPLLRLTQFKHFQLQSNRKKESPETMSYYPKGYRQNDDVPAFDEYDETPYGGGYDIQLTYGHPIPPSEETCYPPTSSDDCDYDRPQDTSDAEPSADGDEAPDNEYQRDSKPNPRMNRPGRRYGEENEYDGGRVDDDEGSEYNNRNSGYRSGYGRKTDSDEYGSRQRRENDEEEENSEYGSGYGRRKTDSDEYGLGYGRRNEYEENSGYRRNTDSGGYGSGYQNRSESAEERSEYGSNYGRSNYESESQGYGASFERPSYGRSEEEDYRKPSYGRHGDDDEGYGRKKYGDDDSDEEEKQRYRNRRHRQDYDD